jgi:hypothetical protein
MFWNRCLNGPAIQASNNPRGCPSTLAAGNAWNTSRSTAAECLPTSNCSLASALTSANSLSNVAAMLWDAASLCPAGPAPPEHVFLFRVSPNPVAALVCSHVEVLATTFNKQALNYLW